MKAILTLGLFLAPFSAFAKTTQLELSRREIATILANPVLKKYSDYFVASIRQGAGASEAATYFVVLEKPFTKPAEKACLMFQSHKANKWEPVGKEGDCKD